MSTSSVPVQRHRHGGLIMLSRVLLAGMFLCLVAPEISAQDQLTGTPIVGELRVLSVASSAATDRLHQAGWLEARGQIVSKYDFPELFDAIGRSWTGDGVAADDFAIPMLTPGSLRVKTTADNAHRSAGSSDQISSNRPRQNKQGPLSCWIFVGRAATSGLAKKPR